MFPHKSRPALSARHALNEMDKNRLYVSDEVTLIKNALRELARSLRPLGEVANIYDIVDATEAYERLLISSLLWNDGVRLALYCHAKNNEVTIDGNRQDLSGNNNRYWDKTHSVSREVKLTYLRLFSFDPMADYGTHVMVANTEGPETPIRSKDVGLVQYGAVDFFALPGDGVLPKRLLPSCCS